MKILKYILSVALAAIAFSTSAQNNIAEEVAWTIGDEPIYKSEIEQAYQEALQDRMPINGDPYCIIPEQIAIQRLFLHQADLDTIEAQPAMIQQQVDAQINYLISNLGSREKLEQYFRRSLPEIREYYARSMTERSRVSQVQSKLTQNLKITPADVRKYFTSLPADSIPYVPTQVEVQIVTLNPIIPRQEIEDVKARLRDYSERVTNGTSDFSTLAILYSEDRGSASRGGELGFMGRGQLVPEFAAVAFNLNDPKKVSKIVESEYGYHIIQLIEKRGDRINCRHILLRPKVAEKDLREALVRLDSVRADIVDHKKATFEDATKYISQDKNTRMSNGVMVNDATGTTRFQMSDLPQEIAKAVSTLQPGEISAPFIMKEQGKDRDVVAIVKLTNRIEAHKANLSDDYQAIKSMYENAQKSKIISDWIEKKIKNTYVRIEDGWRGCEFTHNGWIK